jgi:hypothetical protein
MNAPQFLRRQKMEPKMIDTPPLHPETQPIIDGIVKTTRQRDEYRAEMDRLAAELSESKRECDFLRAQVKEAERRRDFYHGAYVGLFTQMRSVEMMLVNAFNAAKADAQANGINHSTKGPVDLDEKHMLELAEKITPPKEDNQ